MKVNFLIVGTQKAGTSALDTSLRQHPEIEMAHKKELHFFDNENNFSGPEVDYSILENTFKAKRGVKVYGETTPVYLFWPPCIERIQKYNKDMKLLAVLRNPIARAYSHWNMLAEKNAEKESFLYCIQHEKERIKEPLSQSYRFFSYVERGFYAEQIKRIWKYFPKKQVLFLKYEDFLQDQNRSFRQILLFLEVGMQDYNFECREINKGSYKLPIANEEKEYLLDLYNKDIAEVEEMLGWDCSDWRQ